MLMIFLLIFNTFSPQNSYTFITHLDRLKKTTRIRNILFHKERKYKRVCEWRIAHIHAKFFMLNI